MDILSVIAGIRIAFPDKLLKRLGEVLGVDAHLAVAVAAGLGRLDLVSL